MNSPTEEDVSITFKIINLVKIGYKLKNISLNTKGSKFELACIFKEGIFPKVLYLNCCNEISSIKSDYKSYVVEFDLAKLFFSYPSTRLYQLCFI